MAPRERVRSGASQPQVEQPTPAISRAGAKQTEIAAFTPPTVPDSPDTHQHVSSIPDQAVAIERCATSTQQAVDQHGKAALQQHGNAVTQPQPDTVKQPPELLGSHKSLAPSQKLGTGLADIHLIGQITGAVGLGHHPLYCTWQLVYDSHLWAVTNGLTVGRTHASSPELPEDGGLSGVVWDTPLDLALTTSSIQHWPSIIFKLFQRDVWLGRDVFVGYSLCTLPSSAGCHHLSCPVWSAVEARRSLMQDLVSWFTGLNPQLVNESFITDLEQRYEQGQHLHTQNLSNTTSAATHTSFPAAHAVEQINGAGPFITAAGAQLQLYCHSFSRASNCSTGSNGPAAGGRICLRLHVLARGLSGLKHVGGESVARCLERLHNNMERLRRHQQGLKVAQQEDDEEAESEGVRLMRQGRAARLAAVQQQLDDRVHGRDSPLPHRPSRISRELRLGDSWSSNCGKASLGRPVSAYNSLMQSSYDSSNVGMGVGGAARSFSIQDSSGLGSSVRLGRAGRLGTSSISPSMSGNQSRAPNALDYTEDTKGVAAAAGPACQRDGSGSTPSKRRPLRSMPDATCQGSTRLQGVMWQSSSKAYQQDRYQRQ